MKLPLKKAWLVKGTTSIVEGFGFEPETLDDGTIKRENEKFFTDNGLDFVKSNWCNKVFFDLSYAKIFLEDENKKKKQHAREQIAYYEKRIQELSN